MVLLYHYTDDKGRKGIERDRMIRYEARKEHHFGPGVYFTSLSPEDCNNHEIARNNYRIGAQKNLGRTAWVVEVDLPNARVHRCDDPLRNLWRYPDQPLNLNTCSYSIYRFKHA